MHNYISISFTNVTLLPLGNGKRTCCDTSKIGQTANCTDAPLSKRNRRTADDQIKGENRRLNIGFRYTYYIITATPSNNEILFSSSELSPPFTYMEGLDL